jgi:hypothetical protein
MAMKAITVILGISLAIAGTQGCGGFLAYRNLNRDLNASTGKDVHVIIQKIGYPTGQGVS